jgi:hypothetical protein
MIPKGSHKFAGKENLMASFNYWLMNTIQGGYLGLPPLPSSKEFFWAFDFPIAPMQTPAITTSEIGLFNLGDVAMDHLLGITSDGEPLYGTRNQTLIEICCQDQDRENYSRATKTVRNLRDRVIDALSTESIPLLDCNNPIKPKIGVIELDSNSNSINEKYLVDPSNQQVKRYVVIIRIFWTELFQRAVNKTIISNAEIV